MQYRHSDHRKNRLGIGPGRFLLCFDISVDFSLCPVLSGALLRGYYRVTACFQEPLCEFIHRVYECLRLLDDITFAVGFKIFMPHECDYVHLTDPGGGKARRVRPAGSVWGEDPDADLTQRLLRMVAEIVLCPLSILIRPDCLLNFFVAPER